MAVESGSIATQKQSKSGNKKKVGTPQKKDEIKSNGNGAVPSPPAKRNIAPGVRVVRGRIYDSTNGKTCHQCRQKTRDFTAACKSQRNNKPCPIMFCHKCLLNRYGENAEEVSSLGEWSCPKCRGICNCSICMKKRGCQPTGILITTAKATGYSSVSEMLLKGGEQVNRETVAKHIVTSPKKGKLVSPKKIGKENSFDGKVDANLPNFVDKKSKKINKIVEKRKADQEVLEDMQNDTSVPKETGVVAVTNKPKKIKLDESNEMNNEKSDNMIEETSVNDAEKKVKKSRKDVLEEKYGTLDSRTSPRKFKTSNMMSNREAKLNVGVDSENKVNRRIEVAKQDDSRTFENNKRKKDDTDTANGNCVLKQQNSDSYEEISLPVGSELTSVAGIDVCPEDVGNALQFSEFCAVFGRILDVKKGRAEYVLRDIFHGRTGRRGKFSATVQFHIHLLSILKDEEGEDCPEMTPSGKNSWFNVLKECLSESQSVLKAQELDSLDNVADYETLNASQKLRFLNVLCDEVLETVKVRTWIDDENTKLAESVKEAKQKLVAAKGKENSLKQKMKDDIAEAIIAKHGAALSISEHEAIVSRIKSETAKAHAKVLESNGVFMNNNQKPDAVRIDPILIWRGYAYWKLNLSGKTDILCQNVRKGNDTLTLNEKWSAIDDEDKNAIEKHICSLRGKRLIYPRSHTLLNPK